MAGREALRAPVAQSQDPLQLNLTQPETWDVPYQQPSSSSAVERKDLTALALEGSWKAIAQQSATFRQAGPDVLLQEAAWRILALVKLRDYTAAAEELASLGDLDSPEYTHDTPQGLQSRVPFVLRLLTCELPARMGNWRESQEALYTLLDFCRCKAQESLQMKDISSRTALQELWAEREERVVATLFSQHLRLRDYQLALQLLAWLRGRHPESLALLSTIGRVQLAIGHTAAASATFQAVEKLVSESEESRLEEQLLVRHIKGLLLFAQNDYAGAFSEFNAIASAQPEDLVAANNKGVCQMYAGNLMGGVQSLESSLKAQPAAMLNEIILTNLGSMYELCSASSGSAAKKSLSQWAAQVAPDDFDLSKLA